MPGLPIKFGFFIQQNVKILSNGLSMNMSAPKHEYGMHQPIELKALSRRSPQESWICGYILDECFPTFILKMVCRVVLNSRAMILILIPPSIRKITVSCCSSFSADGRSNRFPAVLALAIPECVRPSTLPLK